MKYKLITEGQRKRICALEEFYCQDRLVRVGDIGGYVKDERNLSQESTCWIFSGAVEADGVTVSDQSMVDIAGGSFEGATSNIAISGTTQLVGAMVFAQTVNCRLLVVGTKLAIAYQNATPAAANTVKFTVTRTNGMCIFSKSDILVTASGVAPTGVGIAADISKTSMRVIGAANTSMLGRYAHCTNITMGLNAAAAFAEDDERIVCVYSDGFTLDASSVPNLAEFRTNPLRLDRCYVSKAIFRDNPVCLNKYGRINFTAGNGDLGAVTGDYTLVSSEVDGHYRLWNTKGNQMHGLVKSKESITGDVNVLSTSVHVLDSAKVMASGAGSIELDGNIVISGKAAVACTGGKSTLKGGIRIEGMASLFDSSIVGTGYVGDRASLSRANIAGVVFMKDDADITSMTDAQMPSRILNVRTDGSAKITVGAMYNRTIGSSISMRGSAYLSIDTTDDLHCGSLRMDGDSKLSGIILTGRMSATGGTVVTGGTVIGDLTVSGLFNGNVGTVIDKRVIASEADKSKLYAIPTRYEI